MYTNAGLVLKRLLDIVASGVLLILLSPFLVAIAILVKITSPGPAFYKWRIVGIAGRPLTSYKFRSMYEGADARKAVLEEKNEMSGPVFKIKDDPRITPLGKILRKYSIDELPQLYSVLKGDLSLVGPRPPLEAEYQRFSEWHKLKLQVTPGLTCLWQVNGRNEINNFDDWVQLDLEYIKQRSLALDLAILLRTIPVVLLGRGR